LLKGPNFSLTTPQVDLEITYLEQKSAKDHIVKPDINSPKSEFKREVSRVGASKSYPKEKIDRVKKKIASKKIKEKIIIKKVDEESQVKKEALSSLPEFSDYYQYLRERIKQFIIYPQPFQQGKILVSFTLFRDGTLKEVSIVDKLSTNNAYLCYTAIKSVKDAAPFEPFPEELTMKKEIPFQIFISFELSN
jgi:hypothetical protein